ncbi:unnamed protein product [Phytophthora fragariaefolia]|uniref:Unnamed protein product n=1 Tax=Phytophthora fragariaefolia TaxID=1490495 RepID=A0A9W6YH05_9STRA|nr:unnamed protein product [Phytophthora fragariaefolia]
MMVKPAAQVALAKGRDKSVSEPVPAETQPVFKVEIITKEIYRVFGCRRMASSTSVWKCGSAFKANVTAFKQFAVAEELRELRKDRTLEGEQLGRSDL